jgi:hypothetical protein
MKYTPQVDPATGQFLPREGNEHRAERRRARSASLRGGLEVKPPRIITMLRTQEAERRRLQVERGFIKPTWVEPKPSQR